MPRSYEPPTTAERGLDHLPGHHRQRSAIGYRVVWAVLDGRLTLDSTRGIGDIERQALRQGRNLSVATRLGDLDIIQRLPGVPSYADLLADAIRVTIDDFELVVCSREHLLSMKRARGAPIDLADLERLTDDR